MKSPVDMFADRCAEKIEQTPLEQVVVVYTRYGEPLENALINYDGPGWVWKLRNAWKESEILYLSFPDGECIYV